MRDIDDLQRALGALNAFIVGALRREITERRTARLTGTDVSAWQAALGPYLTRMLDTGRYPRTASPAIPTRDRCSQASSARSRASARAASRTLTSGRPLAGLRE